MESSRDDRLAAALSSLRPAPRPEFAAELDRRAAAGFPRRAGGAFPLSRLLARLRATAPRRALLPVGALALVAIVVATAVVASNDSGSSSSQTLALTNDDAGSSGPVSPAPSVHRAPAAPSQAHSTPPHGGSPGAGVESEIPAHETAVPSAAAGSAVGSESSSSSGAAETGPYPPHANHRDIERAAAIVLGAERTEIGDDSAKVFEAVHTAGGIVLSSSTRNGSEGRAGARFDLLIPSAKLDDALASFSGIAEVLSRHEATNDITAPTVGLSERLQDSNAKIDGLLNELAGSETEVEREAVEAQLRSERNRAAALKARLTNLQRRATFSRVSLRIETSASSSNSGGGWGIDNALHDAGHILAIAAGVTIVGLAILGPLALICLLIWLANRTRVRRGRERVLG